MILAYPYSFGPNTFPANNSALFACETQVCFAVKALFEPILDRRARVVEVKQSAEERHTISLQEQLKGTVFAGDCSNWYINEFGRNAASWPARAAFLWLETFWPNWKAFLWKDGSTTWPLYRLARWWKMGSWCSKASIAAIVAIFLSHNRAGSTLGVIGAFETLHERIRALTCYIAI